MTEENPKNTENTGLIAFSKAFARASNNMTMQERKLCAIYLSKLRWTNTNNDLEIWIDKREIMEKLGSKIDSSDQSAYLRKLAQNMVHHAEIHFDGADAEEWEDMPLFTRRKSTRGKLMVELYRGIMPHLEGLQQQRDYITIWLQDILVCPSNIDGQRAAKLYEDLRLHSDTRGTNKRVLSTKDIKEMFNIPKDGKGSYMRTKEQGGFNRAAFEKYVLDPVFAILAKCQHVALCDYGKDAKGKPVYYTKVKQGGRVQGYQMEYYINMYPNKIRKDTLIDVQAKPEVLKVAQDIIDSKKAAAKSGAGKPKPNTFNNFHQRERTQEENDELERMLLDNSNRQQE